MRFFWLNIYLQEDYSTPIYADDKLFAPISRVRRLQIDEELNQIEKYDFASLNSSIDWIGVTASLSAQNI